MENEIFSRINNNLTVEIKTNLNPENDQVDGLLKRTFDD